MALTDLAIKNAEPREKPYKLGDSLGLFLLVNPNGAKYWRMKYRFAGKEKLLALGVYCGPVTYAANGKPESVKVLMRLPVTRYPLPVTRYPLPFTYAGYLSLEKFRGRFVPVAICKTRTREI